MASFEDPFYLLLLLFLPLLIYFNHFWKGRGGRLVFPFGTWNGAPHPAHSKRLSIGLGVINGLWWVGLVLMVLALAGPAWIQRQKVFLSQGIDIMFVLDLSPSMAAQDFPPSNRFESAVDKIVRFVQGRENDAIGLVTFGKDAALRIPPTLDYDYFIKSLRDPEKGPRIKELGDGSAIGLGLAYAVLHLRATQGREKVIILLTDGENNAGEVSPDTAASLIHSLGYKLYVIGLGSEAQANVEYLDPDTGHRVFGTLEGAYDENLLFGLVNRDRSSLFTASSAATLEQVLRTIDSRETTVKRIKMQVTPIHLWPWFLWTGLVFLMAAFLWRKTALREIL